MYPKVLPDQVSQSIYGQIKISGGALESWVSVDFKTVLENEFWTSFEVDIRLTNTDDFFVDMVYFLLEFRGKNAVNFFTENKGLYWQENILFNIRFAKMLKEKQNNCVCVCFWISWHFLKDKSNLKALITWLLNYTPVLQLLGNCYTGWTVRTVNELWCPIKF